jgi:ELWxxDGT repeat protein
MIAHGNAAYFVLYDAARGWDLWRTDGTPEGTSLLKSNEPYRHALFSLPGTAKAPPIASLGTHLVFVAEDKEHGQELWTSDGTPGGTKLLRDCNPGPESSGIERFIVHDGRLLFWTTSKDLVERPWAELWSTAGTSATTSRISQFPLDRWTWCGFRTGFFVRNTVIFPCMNDEFGTELWMLRLPK